MPFLLLQVGQASFYRVLNLYRFRRGKAFPCPAIVIQLNATQFSLSGTGQSNGFGLRNA